MSLSSPLSLWWPNPNRKAEARADRGQRARREENQSTGGRVARRKLSGAGQVEARGPPDGLTDGLVRLRPRLRRPRDSRPGGGGGGGGSRRAAMAADSREEKEDCQDCSSWLFSDGELNVLDDILTEVPEQDDELYNPESEQDKNEKKRIKKKK